MVTRSPVLKTVLRSHFDWQKWSLGKRFVTSFIRSISTFQTGLLLTLRALLMRSRSLNIVAYWQKVRGAPFLGKYQL